MGTAFQPYLIGNQRTGLDLALNPWLLPSDAYTVLDDCYLYQGRIEKRLGAQVLGSLSNQVYDIDSNQLVIDIDSGNQAVVDPLINTNVAITGLLEYQDSLGNIQLIALSTQRLFRFIPSLGYFYDMAGDNLWTGTSADYFHQYTWLNNMYLVNGVDPLYYYTGSSVKLQVIDPMATGANTVTGAVLVFAFKGRLVIFNTIEDGIRLPQQARWCSIGDPTDWPQANYLAAPTQDIIVGGCFMGDTIVIFFNKSVWTFSYTADADLPFIWTRIPGIQGGAVAKNAVLPFQDQALALSPTRIVCTDGITVYYADEKIPQFGVQMNPSLLKYCNSIICEKYSQLWLTYPSRTDSVSNTDKALILNFDDKSWATMTLSYTSFGLWSQTYDSGSGTVSAGYPQLLAGRFDGKVIQLNTGGVDSNGAVFWCNIQTGQLNPFSKQGRKCWLGWIDLLVDTSLTGQIAVNIYGDGVATPYLTYASVPLTDGKGGDKSLVRIPVNVEATFHQLQIIHGTADQLVIHAVIPWAKQGGRLYG